MTKVILIRLLMFYTIMVLGTQAFMLLSMWQTKKILSPISFILGCLLWPWFWYVMLRKDKEND